MTSHYRNVRDDIEFGLRVGYTFRHAPASFENKVGTMVRLTLERLVGSTTGHASSTFMLAEEPDVERKEVTYPFKADIKIDDRGNGWPTYLLTIVFRVTVRQGSFVPVRIECGGDTIEMGSHECYLRIADAMYKEITAQ